MEQVSCPLCGADDYADLWSKAGAQYVRCRSCTLVYESPRLTESELKAFYSDQAYFVHAGGEDPVSGYVDYFAQCTPQLQHEYFEIVERHANVRRGTYLDVGCGTGGVVGYAAEKGWDACGQEISSWAAAVGKKAGLTIIESSLSEAAIASDSFDAVSMFDVLEHLPSPIEYLREIYRILKPGGVLVVETPNIDGVFALHFYRERSDLVKPRAHICLYSPRSARRLFSTVPFRDVHVKTFPYCRRFTPGYFKGLVASFVLPGRLPQQLTFNESLRIICRK